MRLRPVSSCWCSIRLTRKKPKPTTAKANYERYAYLAEIGRCIAEGVWIAICTQYISAKAELELQQSHLTLRRNGC